MLALPTLLAAALSLFLGPQVGDEVLARPGLYSQLTEPPCSYCIDQAAKGLVADDERVIAWLRAAHQGGAMPLRHFLAAPRVINDTYGLFFYDADGGYVGAYEKDYGFEFHGWRRGVMVAHGPDGSLYSALSGVCFEGPSLGRRLRRIPSMLTTWDHWMHLHPESTAYDLFDGQRYPFAELPTELSGEARQTMGEVDPRLDPLAEVLGVQVGDATLAFPLAGLPARSLRQATVGGWSVAVMWYGPTRTAVAWRRVLEGAKLDFYADEVSPAVAPFKDRETSTRWSLAGRGIDGLLRGKELVWVESVQCRWYAWVAEHPGTEVFAAPAPREPTPREPAAPEPTEREGAIVCDAGQVLSGDLRVARAARVILRVEDRDSDEDLRAAAEALGREGVPHAWWLEVARSPDLAATHPQHQATLQGHDEWRLQFPEAPHAAAGEVLRVHPWVPITTEEGFKLQLQRLTARLSRLPPADEVYVNDLQSSPSACGCGHPQCRWSTDYYLASHQDSQSSHDDGQPSAQDVGPVPSGTPLPPDAAARFLAALQPAARGATLIPVWMAECADGDPACQGVSCYDGACWPALARQWAPVIAQHQRLAVLVLGPARTAQELESLCHIERGSAPPVQLDPARLTPVVVGAEAGAAGCPEGAIRVVTELDQSWTPRLTRGG